MAKKIINIGSSPNDGNGDNLRLSFEKTNDNFTEVYDAVDALEQQVGGLEPLEKIIFCTQANKDTTLGGVIDSTKEYFLDGIIDMGTTQITVPTTGMTIRGYSFDLSGLTSSEDNYTMFISESIAIGSGNLLGFD